MIILIRLFLLLQKIEKTFTKNFNKAIYRDYRWLYISFKSLSCIFYKMNNL